LAYCATNADYLQLIADVRLWPVEIIYFLSSAGDWTIL